MNVLRVVLLGLALSCMPSLGMAATQIWVASGDGIIDISADGAVESFRLAESLGTDVDAFVEEQVRAWRFEPVIEDGRAVPVRAKVELELQAVPSGRSMIVSVSEATFFEIARDSGSDTPIARSGTKKTPPAYPPKLMRDGVTGLVTLVLDVSREGKVVDAEVERLDIRTSDIVRSGGERRKYADQLEQAARSVLPEWRFDADRLDFKNDVARIRVPVSFQMNHMVWGRQYVVVEPSAANTRDAAIADFGADGAQASSRIALLSTLEPLPGG